MITVKLQWPSVENSLYFPSYSLIDSRNGHVFAEDLTLEYAQATADILNRQAEVKPPTQPVVRIGQYWRDNEVVGKSPRHVRVTNIFGNRKGNPLAYVQVRVTTAGINPKSGRWMNVGIRGLIRIEKFLQEFHLIAGPASEPYADAYATSCAQGSGAAPFACPKCNGEVQSGGHGPWCPKPTCKWGWETEMDGSPLKPPSQVIYGKDRRVRAIDRRIGHQSFDRRKS